MVQAVNSFLHGNEVLEHIEAPDVVRVGGVHQRFPGLFGGIVRGRGHESAVLMRVVRANDESVALVVHPVLMPRSSRGYQDRLGSRVGCRNESGLRGDMVARTDHYVLLRGCARQTDEEARIGFGVDYGVAFDGFAECVQTHLVRAPILVQHDVEEACVVSGPHDTSGGVLDFVFQQIAGGQILDCNRVSLGPIGIGAVCKHISVVADGHRSKIEVFQASSQHRFVQNRLRVIGRGLPRVRTGGGPASPCPILASLFIAPIVVPSAAFPRHA